MPRRAAVAVLEPRRHRRRGPRRRLRPIRLGRRPQPAAGARRPVVARGRAGRAARRGPARHHPLGHRRRSVRHGHGGRSDRRAHGRGAGGPRHRARDGRRTGRDATAARTRPRRRPGARHPPTFRRSASTSPRRSHRSRCTSCSSARAGRRPWRPACNRWPGWPDGDGRRRHRATDVRRQPHPAERADDLRIVRLRRRRVRTGARAPGLGRTAHRPADRARPTCRSQGSSTPWSA